MSTHIRSVALLAVLLLGGCVNVGPQQILQDRFDYILAIRDSWEEQMLLNMVALRYGEAPVFLDVDSVIAQYGLETSGNVGTVLSRSSLGGDSFEAGAQAIWSQRPTITYTPVIGQEFTVNLLTPIRPSAIFSMIEAGWEAERSLRLIVKSMNGLTAFDADTGQRNPKFYETLDAFQVLQDNNALGIRIERDGNTEHTYIFLRDVILDPDIEQATRRIADNLNLEDGHDRYEVVAGLGPASGNTVHMQTLSVLDILEETSDFVQVPEEHVAAGRTPANREFDPRNLRVQPPLRVLSSKERPDDAVVRIQSRDWWFFVADTDFGSKKAFSFLMILLQMSAAQQGLRGPAVTIGAGG